jgi:hypothetical protein
MRSGSGEANGRVSLDLPTGQIIQAGAKSGSGKMPAMFALSQ